MMGVSFALSGHVVVLGKSWRMYALRNTTASSPHECKPKDQHHQLLGAIFPG